MHIALPPLALVAQAQPDGFAIGDFWSLTQQAGPLRWPIFFVLAIGLVQVFLKLYELLRDQGASRSLAALKLDQLSLEEVSRTVAKQKETMLSSLWSTMINVFQTRPGDALLHDEITNFVAFQQDQFGVFRRRMDFLSDTAGALGLMGTVWGMFTVFFQGTAEQDVILRGMGIALITTLLGLVVSIILNFSATELSSFFSKRLERVSRKSDELRFRLMELVPAPASAPAPAAAQPVAAPVAREVARPPAREPVAKEAAAPDWRYVEREGNGPVPAGSTTDLALVVRGSDGEPAPAVPILLTLAGDGGSLPGGDRSLRAESDGSGRVVVPVTLPERAGSYGIEVAIPDQPGLSTRLELAIEPGAPSRVSSEGNNQAAIAGMKVPTPLGVQVTDQFGNPVDGVPIGFLVMEGGGVLGNGKADHEVATDEQGFARTPFVLGSHAGQNLVRASIGDSGKSLDFVAFGTEVT